MKGFINQGKESDELLPCGRQPGTTSMRQGDHVREMTIQDMQHWPFIYLRQGGWEKVSAPQVAHACDL